MHVFQIMCNIEAQLENMLGTFHCELQGKLLKSYLE